MIKLGELVMILDLHRQGLTVSAIARQLGIDRKTVRRYIERGLEPSTYGPRPPQPRSTDRFLPYLRDRLAAFPGLTAVRLWRELRDRGYAGGYTAVKRTVRKIRPEPSRPFEVRFETPPGEQAQVDFARFDKRHRMLIKLLSTQSIPLLVERQVVALDKTQPTQCGAVQQPITIVLRVRSLVFARLFIMTALIARVHWLAR